MSVTRRGDEIARILPDEVPRPALTALLDQRWQKSLTRLFAPSGYGKTRVLAQAVRDNAEDPVGIDVYVRARPAFADPRRFANALLLALGNAAEQKVEDGMLSERVVNELARFAPTRVAVLIDDVHLVSSSPDSVGLLGQILRDLPTNAHLVLAGRGIPELPLARLQADDDVLDVGVDELTFSKTELEALAARHGVALAMLEEMAGWPALTRLAIVTGMSGQHDFLMQEVVHGLSPELVRGLAAAALAGQANADVLARCNVSVSPSQLCEHIPLVDMSSDGLVRPHDLWLDVVDLLVSEDERRELVDTIAQWHTEHGRNDEAIMTAASNGCDVAARAALMTALGGPDTQLRGVETKRWIEMFGGSDSIGSDDAELLLLRGWHERLVLGPGHGDDDVARARQIFEERGDVLGEARAGVEYAFRGFLAGDTKPVMETIERSPRLIEGGATYLSHLGDLTNALIADIGGDYETAVALSRKAVGRGVPPQFVELALRHLATLCFLVGDNAGVISACEQLVDEVPTERNKMMLLLAKFADGDIDELLVQWNEMRYVEVGNRREDYSHHVASVFVDACLGIEPDLTLVNSVEGLRPRERLQKALCEWCDRLLGGDENQANDALRAEIAHLGVEDKTVFGEIRRFLVPGYVADENLRELFEDPELDPPLGGYHLRLRGFARVLVALRSGESPDWSVYRSPAETICSMSLPWSVEIACGLVLHDEGLGVELADGLYRATGARAQRWLRHLAEQGGSAAKGAKTLLSLLPAPPGEVTRIETQNDIRLVRSADETVVGRQRVRELLVMLLLRESVNRDVAMTTLWPDMDAARARNNLRITLTHLRNELEPGRAKGEPSFHIRHRGNELVLRSSEHLSADLWEIKEALAAAEQFAKSGDRAEAIVAAAPAVRMWQAPFLAGVRDIADIRGEIAELLARLRDATVEAAESKLSSGLFDEAEELGRKLLAEDPFDERAHVVVIASLLDAEREAAVHQAIDACLLMLQDLGVQPAPATRMLLRRARYPADESRASA